MIELTAADGHRLSAYEAGTGSRSLVVVQEIFGVNGHMRRVCDRFAAAGWRVVAPALFDRVEPGVELGYAGPDREKGIALRSRIADQDAMQDVEAAAAWLGEPVAIVGYCWGGTLAWWGATRSTRFRAAVGWYGGGIAKTATETPNCPVQLHFGEKDAGIPLGDVDTVRAAQPGAEVFVYEGAGHGFGCDERGSFSPASYALAQERTLAFLADNV